MSQTMLLTRPLSNFLASNTTPQLHTLLLLSPTGKLLSSSSVAPASTLRTQATLACSVWNLYHPFQSTTSPLIASSLPRVTQPPSNSSEEQDLSSITVQLEFGIMSIRAMKSGLLFVAIGPSSIPSPFSSSQYLQHATHAIGSSHTSPPGSPNTQLDNKHGSQVSLQAEAIGSVAASETGSLGTLGEGSVLTASIWGVRRQAEEVGRSLEGKLEGFVLSAGER